MIEATKDELRQRLALLTEQETAQREILSGIVSERRDLEMQLTKTLSGIDIGSLVRHPKYGECRVTIIERSFLPSAKPWLARQ